MEYDILLGAPLVEDETTASVAALFRGTATGLCDEPAWTEAPQTYPQEIDANGIVAMRVRAAGDVNGDGVGDVLVGVPEDWSPEKWEGRAFVYLGSHETVVASGP